MLTGYPPQTTEVLAAILTVGIGLAVKVTLPIPEQVPSEAVTVYTVVTDGLTTTVAPTRPNGCQVYEVPADTAFKVAGLVAQMIVGVLNTVTAKGATLI